jgi:hypothetical protein
MAQTGKEAAGQAQTSECMLGEEKRTASRVTRRSAEEAALQQHNLRLAQVTGGSTARQPCQWCGKLANLPPDQCANSADAQLQHCVQQPIPQTNQQTQAAQMQVSGSWCTG